MDTHEIIVFGNECSERTFQTDAHIKNTDKIEELDNLLRRRNVRACVMDCDDRYGEAFDAIARLRPELTVALCEKFDFQRLVVATETARLQHIRLVASLWRQSLLGLLLDVDQLVTAENNPQDDCPRRDVLPVPLRAAKHVASHPLSSRMLQH